MASLNRKQFVRLGRTLQRLFTEEAFWHPKDITPEVRRSTFGREIKLPNGRWLTPNDLGHQLQRSIVAEIYDAGVFEEAAEYSDIWSALQAVLRDCFAKNLMPEDGAELLALVVKEVTPEIRDRTFVVAMHGVELKGVRRLQLGRLLLTVRDDELIYSQGVKDDSNRLPGRMRTMAHYPWLVGAFTGTHRAAKRQFDSQARLAAGMLAVSAASSYQHGAHAFRIGAILSAEDSIGPCDALFWDSVDMHLGFSVTSRRSQDYIVDEALVQQFKDADVFDYAFEILQKAAQNEIESAIAKAIFWFADAHRDSLPVMRFVKYWSCVEAFFSVSHDAITQNVAIGMTSVLTYGDYRFLPAADYEQNKQRIKKLYAHRSSAVHRASHDHVSDRDVADLSQWTAWLIISMVSFAQTRYKTLRGVLNRSLELDAQVSAAAAGS